tara:strand:- start:371 stop:988 length:618 start_codon:yes stop_codon:yes gene_type:complete
MDGVDGCKVRVVIVPGNGCTPVDDCNWYSWVAEKLKARCGDKVEIILKDMPDPYGARETEWIPFIEEELIGRETNRDRVILIGHSSGAVAALRLLERGKLGAVVFVSVCWTDLGHKGEAASGYYNRPFDWNTIKENATQRVLFGANDDPFIPWHEQEHVFENIDAQVHAHHGRGHFMESKFPELVDEVERLIEVVGREKEEGEGN